LLKEGGFVINSNFRKLYAKYVNGSRWLGAQKRAGKDIEKDKARFILEVRDPIIEGYFDLDEDEKKYIGAVTVLVRFFDAEVVTRQNTRWAKI